MKLDVSESIGRPAADVFRFVATDHVKNHPRWDPQLTLAQETPGPIGIGTRIRRTRVAAGTRTDGEMEIVEFEPGHVMGAVISDGPMVLRSWMTVESDGEEASRLIITVESDSAPLDRMKEPIKGSLRRIKEMVEAGG